MNKDERIEELECQIEDLKRWLAESKEVLDFTRQNNFEQLERERQEKRDLSEKITNHLYTIKVLRDELDEAKKDSEETSELKVKIEELETKVSSLCNQRFKLQVENEKISKQMIDLELKHAELFAEDEHLKDKIDSLTADRGKGFRKIEEQRKDLVGLRRELETCISARRKGVQKIEDQTKEINALRDQNDQLRSEVFGSEENEKIEKMEGGF